MRIVMTRGTCLGNGVDAYPGDIVEVDDDRAEALIRQGRALFAQDRTAETANAESVVPAGTSKRKGK